MPEICPDCGSPVYEYPRLDLEKLKRIYEEKCRGCSKNFGITREEELPDDILKIILKKVDFYKINNIVVWEIPKYGNATWFFQGDLASILIDIKIYGKSGILDDNQSRKISGFEGRVYHDYYNIEEWKTKINEVLERIFG
jgi:hypothetical protein